MKKVIVCGVLTVLCIVATVLLRGPMGNADLEYTEVEATVISSEAVERTVRTRYSTSRQTVYEVVVRYDGENYYLINAHNAYSYQEGKTVKVYLAGGKMYANEEGVRSGSLLGKAYSVALIGSLVMFFVTIILWSKAAQEKRQAG